MADPVGAVDLRAEGTRGAGDLSRNKYSSLLWRADLEQQVYTPEQGKFPTDSCLRRPRG